jgi:phage gpG-like protein
VPGPPAIKIEGLKELRRDLKTIEQGLPRELGRTMKIAVQPVARLAASLAQKKTGALAASVKASVAGTNAAIRSRLPYANVQAWGGTTGRGHKPGVGGSGSVKVKGSLFPEKAAEAGADTFLEQLADGVDGLLTRHGFK